MPRPEPGAGSGKHGSYNADFFEKHLSKMMMAPSFAGQGAPPMHADGFDHGAAHAGLGAPLRVTESEASTQCSGGLQIERTGSSTPNDIMPTASGTAAEFASLPHHRSAMPPPGYHDPTASYMQADYMPSMGASSSSSPVSYKVGDHIEVWSKTHQVWCRGTVESVEDGLVNLKYTVPDGSSMTKLMPNGHEQLRLAAAPSQAANVSAHSSFRPGDQVEVFSNTHQSWCPGCVESLDGAMVNVRYMTPEGLPMTKMIPDGHAHLRLTLKPHETRQDSRSPMHGDPHSPMRSYGNPARNMQPPPPPPFERMQPMLAGESVLDRAPPPEVYDGVSLHASPMASMQPMGNQAPSCMASQQAWQQDVTAGPRLADTHAQVPPTPMVLCGMPVKNGACGTLPNKPAVASKPDRCCRCAMPLGGSYFDHTCPKCSAVVCQACLEDLKCVVNSYRCPSCGDSTGNEETLKDTLWKLKMYRSAQRAVGAVPGLVAGLFGSGPEAANKSQLPVIEEPVEMPPPAPAYQPQDVASPSAPRGPPAELPPMATAAAAPAAPVVAAATSAAAVGASPQAAPEPVEGRVFTASFATFWGAAASAPKKKGTKAADPGKTLLDEYKAGDPIEVWSNSVQAWLRGFVEKVDDGMVSVKYFTADGQAITKLLPDGHADMRHAPTTQHAPTAPAQRAAPEQAAKNMATGTALVTKPNPAPAAPKPQAMTPGAGAVSGTPDYQTQPPVGWFEGAGGYGPDTAAVGMLKAAAAPHAAVTRSPGPPQRTPAGGLTPPNLFAAVQPQQKQPQQQQQQRSKTPDRRAAPPARNAATGTMCITDAFSTRLPPDQRSPMR